MSKKCFILTEGPTAKGPYSPAVEANGLVFISGQGPFKEDGTLEQSSLEAETRRVMDNLGGVLKAAGLDFKDVVKTTCYLANIDDFAAFNDIYKTYFPEEPPARTTIQAGRLPLGFNVEVEAIAVRPS